MGRKLKWEVDVEGPVDMMDRGEERDSWRRADGRCRSLRHCTARAMRRGNQACSVGIRTGMLPIMIPDILLNSLACESRRPAALRSMLGCFWDVGGVVH